jgi:hypothetical protein
MGCLVGCHLRGARARLAALAAARDLDQGQDGLEVGGVCFLAGGQVDREGASPSVAAEVDLAGQSAPGAAEFGGSGAGLAVFALLAALRARRVRARACVVGEGCVPVAGMNRTFVF